MIKKKRNLGLMTLIAVAFLFIGTSNVFAATSPQWIGGKYTRAVSRISWWMSYDNNGGWYEFQIKNAVNNWQSPGWSNPLAFVAASSNAGTMMDIYTQNKSFWSTQAPLAETRHYDGNGNWMRANSQGKLNGNYVFTRIYLNDDSLHNKSADEMRGTITHEIGHTLGLNENNGNVNSIMCQLNSNRQVQTVQQIDNTAVVNIYK